MKAIVAIHEWVYREMFRDFLESYGIATNVANNGLFNLYEILPSVKPDLLILGIRLLSKKPVEALQRIRRARNCDSMAIILMGSEYERDLASDLEGEFDDFAYYTSDLRQLRYRIENVLGFRRTLKELRDLVDRLENLKIKTAQMTKLAAFACDSGEKLCETIQRNCDPESDEISEIVRQFKEELGVFQEALDKKKSETGK